MAEQPLEGAPLLVRLKLEREEGGAAEDRAGRSFGYHGGDPGGGADAAPAGQDGAVEGIGIQVLRGPAITQVPEQTAEMEGACTGRRQQQQPAPQTLHCWPVDLGGRGGIEPRGEQFELPQGLQFGRRHGEQGGRRFCVWQDPQVRLLPDLMSWKLYGQLKQRLADGDRAGVIEPLRELRRSWQEPALAILLADALMQENRPDEALSVPQADIDAGIDNHWSHYCLGHQLAVLGRLEEAAAAFRRCHGLQGWSASEERGYFFTHDYFSAHIKNWRQWFASTINTAPIRILEVGSWQGGTTLWLLDHVIVPRGGEITCCDTWKGSSEHTFLAFLGISIEDLFDANVARTGLAQYVRKHKARSQNLLPLLSAGSFDFFMLVALMRPEP